MELLSLISSAGDAVNKGYVDGLLASYVPLTGEGANGTWGIGITGNAATATRLETARTIWGRSFDGTGDITLGPVLGNGVPVYVKDTADNACYGLYMDSSNQLRLGYGNHTASRDTLIYGNAVKIFSAATGSLALCATTNGYVGINIASPTSRLHVSGDARVTGSIFCASLSMSSTTGGWAKGLTFRDSANTCIGGMGLYGNNDSINRFYIGGGTSPWSSYWLGINADAATFTVPVIAPSLTVSGDLLPSSVRSYSLGTYDSPWKSVAAAQVTFAPFYTSLSSDQTAGWYRVYTSQLKNSSTTSVRVCIGRSYNEPQNEGYVFDITVGYRGDIHITQVSGVGPAVRLITKIRVDWTNGQPWHVDFYRDDEPTANTYYVYGEGVGTFQLPARVDAPTGTTVEFATRLGFATSGTSEFDGDIYANSGLLLPNHIGLDCLDSNGNEVSSLFLSDTNVLFVGYGTAGKYYTRIYGNTVALFYGSGTVGLYLNYSGNIGIGTTSPSYKMHIAGSLYTTASPVMLGGPSACSSTGVAIHQYSQVAASHATALGYNSRAGIRTDDTAYPYAFITPYTTQAMTVDGNTVYGAVIDPSATLTFTYDGTEYTVTNPNSSYRYVFVLIDDSDSLFCGSSIFPMYSCRLYTPNDDRRIATDGVCNIVSVMEVSGTIKGILIYSWSKTLTREFSVAATLYAMKKSSSTNYSGSSSVASGYYSVASGYYSVASGYYSVASGAYSVASGYYSVASGYSSVASGYYSVASGYYSVASGAYSVARHNHAKVFAGWGDTSIDYQTVLGLYNETTSDALVLGWGSSSARKNIFTVSTAGVITAAGAVLSGALSVAGVATLRQADVTTLKVGTITLTDDNGALKIDGNAYATGQLAAGAAGEDGGTVETVTTAAEWYTIKTTRTAAENDIESPIYTHIDGWNSDLADTDRYRLVLLTYKAKKRQGKGWRIPMFSPRWDKDTGEILFADTESAIAWENTWWAANGRKVEWWNGTATLATCGLSTANDTVRFSVSKSRKLMFGVALYRRDDTQWTRCSNVAKVMLFINKALKIDTRVIE